MDYNIIVLSIYILLFHNTCQKLNFVYIESMIRYIIDEKVRNKWMNNVYTYINTDNVIEIKFIDWQLLLICLHQLVFMHKYMIEDLLLWRLLYMIV